MQFDQQVRPQDEGPQHVVRRKHPGVWSGHPKAFQKGKSGNPLGAAGYLVRQNEVMERWCKSAGVDIGSLTEPELSMLRQAAMLSLLRPSSNPDRRVRVANSINRTLVTLGLVQKHTKRREPKPEPEQLPSWAKRLESAR